VTLLVLFIVYAITLAIALAWAGHWSRAGASSQVSAGRPTKILIIGATGGTGRQLTAQALERGYTVTALVRDPRQLRVDHAQLRIVQGDVLDEGSVDAAMRGQEAVVSALGHKRFFGPTRILSEGTRNILRAMKAQGVPRFVCETSLGIGDSAGRMGVYYTFFVIPVILPFYYWDKTRQERSIAESGLQWVIVRPGVLTNGNKRGSSRHGRDVGSFLWTRSISRADAAAFMLDQLATDANLRTAPGVCD
jgi:putative NADH-flavin reductase